MKTIIRLFILSFVSILFLHCSKNTGSDIPIVVSGQLPVAPKPSLPGAVSPTAVEEPVYVYGEYFRVYNTSIYRRLLETCRRCGLKRLIQGPYGQTQYQRFWTGHQDPKRCENWLSKGYIQIEFLENRLPTTAKVLIKPKYTGSAVVYDFQGAEQEIWGEAFEIKAQARPINENDGFEILVSPSDGLLGVYSLVIRSKNTNHVRDSTLNITISYGQNDSQTIVSQQLKSLDKRAVPPAQFSCSQYTN